MLHVDKNYGNMKEGMLFTLKAESTLWKCLDLRDDTLGFYTA